MSWRFLLSLPVSFLFNIIVNLLSAVLQDTYFHFSAQSLLCWILARKVDRQGKICGNKKHILSQSDLTELRWSPWIAHFQCWTGSEVAILTKKSVASGNENVSYPESSFVTRHAWLVSWPLFKGNEDAVVRGCHIIKWVIVWKLDTRISFSKLLRLKHKQVWLQCKSLIAPTWIHIIT